MSHSVPAPPGRPRWQAPGALPLSAWKVDMFFKQKWGSGIADIQERLLSCVFFGISLLCVFLKLPVSRRKTGHVKRFTCRFRRHGPTFLDHPKSWGCLWKGSKVGLKSCEVRWKRALFHLKWSVQQGFNKMNAGKGW